MYSSIVLVLLLLVVLLLDLLLAFLLLLCPLSNSSFPIWRLFRFSLPVVLWVVLLWVCVLVRGLDRR